MILSSEVVVLGYGIESRPLDSVDYNSTMYTASLGFLSICRSAADGYPIFAYGSCRYTVVKSGPPRLRFSINVSLH